MSLHLARSESNLSVVSRFQNRELTANVKLSTLTRKFTMELTTSMKLSTSMRMFDFELTPNGIPCPLKFASSFPYHHSSRALKSIYPNKHFKTSKSSGLCLPFVNVLGLLSLCVNRRVLKVLKTGNVSIVCSEFVFKLTVTVFVWRRGVGVLEKRVWVYASILNDLFAVRALIPAELGVVILTHKFPLLLFPFLR